MLEYWNDGKMSHASALMCDFSTIPIFQSSNVPFFHSLFSPFAPVNIPALSFTRYGCASGAVVGKPSLMRCENAGALSAA
jgi:hypothetical protein